MSSLFARMRRSFYDVWAEGARECGISEKDITEYIDSEITQAMALAAGLCPQCARTIARYVDGKRQQGPSAVPGTWVQYRCSTAPPPGTERGEACDFMVDLVEGEETMN